MLKALKKIIQYPRLTIGYPATSLDTEFITGRPCIEASLCTMCGECVRRCPSGAIVFDRPKMEIGIKLDECIFCSLCAELCPSKAVTMVKEFELAERSRAALRERTVVGEPSKIEEISISGEAGTEGESLAALVKEVKEKSTKIFGRSLQIREVDAGSCNGCDYEINALNNPFNDIERLGIHFVASPRHADMLLVTGTATRNMEQALQKTYEATPDPKLVVAVGACACSGGIFKDSYATRNGIDCIIPVDVYVPGCPPRPQAIMYGILKALDRVK